MLRGEEEEVFTFLSGERRFNFSQTRFKWGKLGAKYGK